VARRVVVTGCGVVTAAGIELDGFWQSLVDGACFIKPLQGFAYPDLPNMVGAEVTLPPEDALPPAFDTDVRRARCAQLALAAARRAIGHADLPAEARERAGVAMGMTMGEERQVGDLSERWKEVGPEAVDAGFAGRAGNHRIPSLIAGQLGLGGPILLNATACSSGNAAVAWGYDLVASGAADAALAGGSDTLTRLIYCGFHRMSALSKSLCRPFDKSRDGVSFGEGAAIVVLEELEHARRRGARILAEVAGYGVSNDVHHITAPHPEGDGVKRAILQALETTGTALDAIDYVSAHGTGTQYNDLGEVKALKAVFGARAATLPTSSIKGIIGHTNGAAGAIEAVACTLALVHQTVPPTANLVEPDPEFGMDFVTGKGRAMRVDTCLNLSAGFGGSNVCTVFKRVS
jgi:3-oxoacyl-[acyl-carrier-protein] synthase II